MTITEQTSCHRKATDKVAHLFFQIMRSDGLASSREAMMANARANCFINAAPPSRPNSDRATNLSFLKKKVGEHAPIRGHVKKTEQFSCLFKQTFWKTNAREKRKTQARDSRYFLAASRMASIGKAIQA
ncbi:hypothetical protein HMPREF1640_01155 [Prevotella sp. S7-1-8]|nr:hypothetical protein HMPREF1640_01155 [Prevotella sp. S7-1-8]